MSRCSAADRSVCARQFSRSPSSGGGREGVDFRSLGEIDERFLVEQFDLAACREDGPGRPPCARSVGNGLFQRQGEDDDVGLVEGTGGEVEERKKGLGIGD